MNIYKRLIAPPTSATRDLTPLGKLRHIFLGPVDPLIILHREVLRVTNHTTSAKMQSAPESTTFAYHLLQELEAARVHYHVVFALRLVQRNVLTEDAARAEIQDIQCGDGGYWPLPVVPDAFPTRVKKVMAKLEEIKQALVALDESVDSVRTRWEAELDEREEGGESDHEEEQYEGIVVGGRREWWEYGQAEQGDEGKARSG
ncbi:hypothetical protein EDC01DRAFT_635186 [Geopyxis carbonaria]|nr:hypothetical protein EDC01DRAFT_635186 [Geopyxis carbonaria]